MKTTLKIRVERTRDRGVLINGCPIEFIESNLRKFYLSVIWQELLEEEMKQNHTIERAQRAKGRIEDLKLALEDC